MRNIARIANYPYAEARHLLYALDSRGINERRYSNAGQ